MDTLPSPQANKARILKGSVGNIVKSLNRQGYKNLYIDGGKTIQCFLEQDLIDELIITRIPVILGSGIPLFTKMNKEIKLEHVKTNVYNGSLVKSRYKRIN
jgi:dihydrofolate reductase